MLETLAPIALGVVGWFVAKFLGEPFRRFFDLKGEITRQLIVFDNVRAAKPSVFPELRADEQARLALAEASFRELAAKLKGFEQSEPITIGLRLIGYNLRSICSALIGLSNTICTYGGERAHFSAEVRKLLKLDMA